MELVNVYDFDKTILPYDSTEAFFAFCLRRWPRVAGPALGALPYAAGMKLGLTDKTRAKEVFYRFLTRVPDVDAAVEEFWRGRFGAYRPWYLAQKPPGRHHLQRLAGLPAAPRGEGARRAAYRQPRGQVQRLDARHEQP